MRREGRLHGYEFERSGESNKRVKVCNQPTNRSKFRSKYPQQKAGHSRSKALKKMKGHRNKAHASDMAANHKMHEWALHHPLSAPCLADSIDESDLDLSQQPPSIDTLRVLFLSQTKIRTQAQIEEGISNGGGGGEEEEEDSNGSDWLDLGSTYGYDDDDDWFLC